MITPNVPRHTDLDGQQQVGAARRHDAAVRRVRGRQHARQTRQHVGADGRLGLAQRPVPPAAGRSDRRPVARPLVPVVVRAVADAGHTALGPVAALDSGREKPYERPPPVVFRRFPG